ncbi:pilus assembly protein TadG-related protein [Novosphingobium sp. 9U]|uniref:pilus assembly protein TadG-related protein n=1 Tax=Novosphingobium sp. 9U TaxID=2653158 RepID=UPI001F2E7131|nr:pilus assembly protein TadG-related protein [Novosphingobium sp. 9U]
MFITAASAVVFIALGGGALDIARMYLVKNRLQQACDAGVLAYRRSMQGTNVQSTTYPTALAYFNANFTSGKYGTSGVSFPEPTVDANVVVHGTATVTAPMTLMKLFGFEDAPIETKCDAQLQLPNTDVMFVLDTTGSMTDINSGDTESKIAVLRKAVTSFYNTLESAKVPGTQVRYGFVPYSNTVNVGMLLKREWMVDTATYQSRVFDVQKQEATGSTQSQTLTTYTAWAPSINSTTSTTYGSAENCVAPANATTTTSSNSAWSPDASSLPRSRTNYRTYGGDTYSAAINSSGQCVITKTSYPTTSQTRTETVDKNPNAGQANMATRNYWWYKPVAYDVRAFKGSAANGLMAGGTIGFPVNNPGTDTTKASPQSFTFGSSTACIEERKTLRPYESGTAWDMDVDSAPVASDPDTQWRPFIPSIVFARSVTSYGGTPSGWSTLPAYSYSDYIRLSSQSSLYNACPSPARKLQTKEAGLTSTALQTYLNGLVTRGYTYHDIGFLWGLRLISREGLFGSENAAAPNGSSIGRNIIFMTDGDTETHFQAYDAYGLSALDRRRTDAGSLPSDSAQDGIVEDRLSKYCTIAKSQKGITVWVIAFGTSLTSLLQDCASQGRAFQANNAEQLNATFAEIASKIAQLRLTK